MRFRQESGRKVDDRRGRLGRAQSSRHRSTPALDEQSKETSRTRGPCPHIDDRSCISRALPPPRGRSRMVIFWRAWSLGSAGSGPRRGLVRNARESANQISNPRVPPTSVRTKRTPGGVRPRRLDWHIDSPPDYAKAPTATTNHQQGRNGTKTVFPRTPPKEIAWFRSRLEPISLRVSVQLVRTDF